MIIWTNATGEVNANSPMFTGREGEPLSALTSDQLNVSLAYRNVAHGELSQDDPLIPLDYTLFVAVYKSDGTLVHFGTDRRQMPTLNQVGSFQVSLEMPDNLDGKYARENYYAKVFLWDSKTFIPVTDSYILSTPSV